MDETYIKVKGRWTYVYRAVDRDGKTLDFMLSERRDLAAARRSFKRAIGAKDVPGRVVIDKSGAKLAGLQAVNMIQNSPAAVASSRSGKSNTSTTSVNRTTASSNASTARHWASRPSIPPPRPSPASRPIT
jgi:transposase-like protein